MTEHNRHDARGGEPGAGAGGTLLDVHGRGPGTGLERVPDPWEAAGLVPPRRLGALLSESRARRGATLADVAAASGGRFTFATLASIERGTTALTDRDLAVVAQLYGVEADSLIPQRSRLVVDLEESRMWVAQTPYKARLDRQTSTHDVLSRYLSMVYCMRNIDPGTRITLRVEDLEVLGKALATDEDELLADLRALMDDADGSVSWRSKLLRRRVLIPAAGLLVAFCGVGALVLVQSGRAGATEPAAEAPDAVLEETVGAHEVRLGPAVVQERNADGTPGPIVER